MTNAKRYIINVQGAVYRGDKFLISKRSELEDFMPGIVGLAGGKIEAEDEEAEDVLLATLAREIYEEVNVRVDNFQLVTTNYFEADGVPVINIVFLCRYVSGEAQATDPNEVEEIYWMTVEETLSHPKCMPWTQSYLSKAEVLRQNIIGL